MLIPYTKEKYTAVTDKFIEYYHKVTQPHLASIVAFSIVLVGMISTTVVIHGYDVKVAEAQVKVSEIEHMRDIARFKNAIKIKKMQTLAEIETLTHKIKLAELHAASNPYVIEAQHSATPVNVFIDTTNSKYVIETSDGATEIAVSMITVNNIRYTPEQRKLMTMAFHIGQDVGFPETIQSLLLQETRAGAYGDRIGDTNLPMGMRSYGVMQMKVATARKVLRKHKGIIPKYFPRRKEYKRIRDEEIIIKLIQDDEFNIRLAALNFDIHRKLSKSWAQAVVAYNTGQGAANGIKHPKMHVYYNHILKRMISEVRPFNRETNLTL